MNTNNPELYIQYDKQVKPGRNGANTICGKVMLQLTESTTIESIEVKLITVVRGKMKSSRNVNARDLALSNSKPITANQIYEFPFEINEEVGCTSYKGRNGMIAHFLEAHVNFKPEAYAQLKPGVLSSMKKWVNMDSSLVVVCNYFYEDSHNGYKVLPGPCHLKRKTILWLMIAMTMLVFPLPYFLFSPSEPFHWFIMIVFCALVGYTLQGVYFSMTVVNITLHLENRDDDTFAIVSHDYAGKLSGQPEFYYEVEEVVRDTRGTSTTTYRTVMYKSAKKSKNVDIKEEDLVFEFPQRIDIATKSEGDLSIEWIFYIETTDPLGLAAIYKGIMYVYRKPKNNS